MRSIILAIFLLAPSTLAFAKPACDPGGGRAARAACKVAPDVSRQNRVDPLATGNEPGSIRFGDTQVRIGGRVRVDATYQSGR